MGKKTILTVALFVCIPILSYALPISSITFDRPGSGLTKVSFSSYSALTSSMILLFRGDSGPVYSFGTDTPPAPKPKATKPAVRLRPPASVIPPTYPVDPHQVELPPPGTLPPSKEGPAPVPEPSTMFLLGSGMVAIAAYRKYF